MPALTAEQLTAVQALQARVVAKVETDPVIRQQFVSLGQYLLDSEAQLIALMSNTAPPAGGSIEFGMVLYWIHNDLPDDTFFNWLASQFPASQITPSMYALWQTTWAGPGIIAPDGTMVADGPFSQLDKGWLYASMLYILRLLGEVPLATFGTKPNAITLPNQPNLSVAILGDWGTGPWNDCGTQGPATAIMQQIQQLPTPPDLIIHLGDVYYAGTGHLPLGVNVLMILLAGETGVAYFPTEEVIRFIDRWWSASPAPKSFTLNSNHESYSGSNGYFSDALGNSLFKAQQNTSYFVLYYQDWAILGFDSAFYSTSFFDMQGALQDATDDSQITWAQGLNLSGKNVIALTHHTALCVEGFPIAANQLYNDMYQALNNRDPDYWYWGHTHNGVVYNNNVTMSSTRKTTTLCRCVGHAALPFGNAYYWQNSKQYNLDQNGNIDYYAHTPVPNPNQCPQWTNRVKNGFAVVTLGQGTIAEAFYEQGNTTPLWTNGSVLAKR
ncbi:MAG TPA: metallophosphoesterase [Candidatus Sulfotelmatobacter sp.]